MEPYNFWQDFFATYRSSPDAIKALWLIVPPAFVLGLCWIVTRRAAIPHSHPLPDENSQSFD